MSATQVFISVLIHPPRRMEEALRVRVEVTPPTGACVGATGAGTAWPEHLAPGTALSCHCCLCLSFSFMKPRQ